MALKGRECQRPLGEPRKTLECDTWVKTWRETRSLPGCSGWARGVCEEAQTITEPAQHTHQFCLQSYYHGWHTQHVLTYALFATLAITFSCYILQFLRKLNFKEVKLFVQNYTNKPEVGLNPSFLILSPIVFLVQHIAFLWRKGAKRHFLITCLIYIWVEGNLSRALKFY